MEIMVNGSPHTVADRIPLLALLESLGLKPQATVVELNGSIVERPKYAEIALADRDTLELVRFVGGG
jgi:thiamine biosynthesis protein ThiS